MEKEVTYSQTHEVKLLCSSHLSQNRTNSLCLLLSPLFSILARLFVVSVTCHTPNVSLLFRYFLVTCIFTDFPLIGTSFPLMEIPIYSG